jgi:wobble nucleotide-excising tRNase
MIQQISKLKNFGIFQDYKPSKDLKPFTQYNLFYGWNGSGKSTVAKLFFSLADKKNHSHFENGEFTVQVKDQLDVSHKNIAANTLNVRVFNRDFIERNVNFDESKANSILILSEEKKEEMDKYKKLQLEYGVKDADAKQKSKAYDKAVEDLKKNLSKWASNIKKSFELIETTNSYYLNYDRTKLSAFIKDNRSNIEKDAILTPEDVKDLKNAIKPTQKSDIGIDTIQQIDASATVSLFERLENLISRSILSKQIDRLTNNPDINQWVNEGLDIHLRHNSTNCEFCKQQLPNERIVELNNHFSKAYSDLLNDIQALSEEVADLLNNVDIKLPEAIELYDEFQTEFQKAKILFSNKQQPCKAEVIQAETQIARKRINPFELINYKFSGIEQLFNEFNSEVIKLIDIVGKHNGKNEKFDEEVKKGQYKLELHFVSEILISENYDETEKDIKGQKEELDKILKELTVLENEIKKLEVILINESVGADAFNKSLAKFIGRKDISIEFDKSLKGYKLIRAGKSEAAKNLSEGEKTAIAFVYFISKLKENGNSINQSLIIVDDPISSFDSNHLFHSYSFLKQECERAQQLFILTYNFQYFKLIRDWLQKKNEKKPKPDGTVEEKIKSSFYSVEASNEESRKATLNNANSTLLDFNSEYHFIFHKLFCLMELKTLDLEKAFLIANLSRKLLEGFLTFKFPKGRNDFSQLLQAGCPDNETREKVYRFINKYSHNQQIEFLDSPIDNLLGEGENIVEEVLKIISSLDKQHFQEMEEVCKKNVVS